MWIDDIATDAHLRTWLKHTPAMKLASTIDGQIVWANPAFCEWMKMTLGELRQRTWMQISVPDANLEADIAEIKNLDAYRPTYTVSKLYVPKNERPQWGDLTVLRYPLTGPIEVCLCTWSPLKNGTATAFATAMDHSDKIEKRLTEMAMELQRVVAQSDDEKFVLAGMGLLRRHPKVAMVFVGIALSIFGLNNVVELLQRTGFVPQSVKVQQVETATE